MVINRCLKYVFAILRSKVNLTRMTEEQNQTKDRQPLGEPKPKDKSIRYQSLSHDGRWKQLILSLI